jgi:hypothetical protein
MATFLELVQELARESGSLDPNAITAVEGLTGRAEKMVGWVRKAYVNIQNSRRDWGWLMTSFTANLVPGTAVYTPASFAITRFANWAKDRDWYMPLSLYDPLVGLTDEHELPNVSHEYWRTRYGRNDQSIENWNRPTEYAISPRNEIVFGPYPDKAYTIRGQYQKGPQVLETSNEVPEMPSRFHEMIVWEANRLLLIHDGAYNDSQLPTMEMVRLRHELELDQLPEVMVP